MSLRMWQFVALLFAALGMTMGAAHVLEMPPKMQYGGALYAAVNRSLYPLFAVVGGPIQIGAILAAAVLAYRTRDAAAHRWAVGGALALLLSFLAWAALVAPVNAEWSRLAGADDVTMVASYLTLRGRWVRGRWEFGHVVAFALWLGGFCLLLGAVVTGRPKPDDH